MLPLLTSILPSVGSLLTNKYVIMGGVVASLMFGIWWYKDSYEDQLVEYKELKIQHDLNVQAYKTLQGLKEKLSLDYEYQKSLVNDLQDLNSSQRKELDSLKLELDQWNSWSDLLDVDDNKSLPEGTKPRPVVPREKQIDNATVKLNSALQKSIECLEKATYGDVETWCIQ